MCYSETVDTKNIATCENMNDTLKIMTFFIKRMVQQLHLFLAPDLPSPNHINCVLLKLAINWKPFSASRMLCAFRVAKKVQKCQLFDKNVDKFPSGIIMTPLRWCRTLQRHKRALSAVLSSFYVSRSFDEVEGVTKYVESIAGNVKLWLHVHMFELFPR